MTIEKLLQTSNSSRLMAGISTVLILGLGIYNWAVSPQTNYLAAAQQYEEIMGDSKLKMLSIKKQIAEESKKKDILFSEVEEIRSRLFTAEDAAVFFSSLEDIAEQNGTSLVSFNYIKGASGKKQAASKRQVSVTPQSARLNIKGSFSGIRNFVKTLEECSQDITVIDMNIDSRKTSSGNFLNCNIVVKILIIEEMENPSNV